MHVFSSKGLLSFLLVLLAVVVAQSNSQSLSDVPRGVGTWSAVAKHGEEELGNHRAVVYVDDGAERILIPTVQPKIRPTPEADAVWVRIPWRRRDAAPEKKDIIIVDASTGQRVRNVVRANINRGFGDLVFQPPTRNDQYAEESTEVSSDANLPGYYFVYYMPYKGTAAKNWPATTYLPVENTADPNCLRVVRYR